MMTVYRVFELSILGLSGAEIFKTLGTVKMPVHQYQYGGSKHQTETSFYI